MVSRNCNKEGSTEKIHLDVLILTQIVPLFFLGVSCNKNCQTADFYQYLKEKGLAKCTYYI